MVLRGTASGYREPRSTYVRIYLFLDLVIGKGPTTSVATLSNSQVIWGGGDTIGALECVRLAVFWQRSQDWQVALTSVARWGPKKCLRILYLVRLWPPCPAIGVEWAKSSTCWCRLAGRTICQIGSPSRSVDCRWRMPCLVIYGEFSWSAEDQGSASVGSLRWSLRRASESALDCERGSKSGSDEGSVSVSGRDRFVCGKSKSSPMISGWSARSSSEASAFCYWQWLSAAACWRVWTISTSWGISSIRNLCPGWHRDGCHRRWP